VLEFQIRTYIRTAILLRVLLECGDGARIGGVAVLIRHGARIHVAMESSSDAFYVGRVRGQVAGAVAEVIARARDSPIQTRTGGRRPIDGMVRRRRVAAVVAVVGEQRTLHFTLNVFFSINRVSSSPYFYLFALLLWVGRVQVRVPAAHVLRTHTGNGHTVEVRADKPTASTKQLVSDSAELKVNQHSRARLMATRPELRLGKSVVIYFAPTETQENEDTERR
jgi:hypothetical protein